MPSTLANHDVVPQSSFNGQSVYNKRRMVGVTECSGSCTLTLTAQINTATHLCSPFSYHLGLASSAHHLGLKRAKAQVLPHINPRLTAKGSRKSLIAEPVTAISRRESRHGQPVKLPGSEEPLHLGRACANMGGPKSIRTAEGIPFLSSADMEPTTCCLWS
ncbi:uncharacterized protein TrAtP1_004008 [Trichoderma atroviride]|uniref:uncharacterized protein n=1 Tax=Hypocrea atroviridis TaxID=63577 RepID=UPI003319D319|nr:hypothetical protein TrAtP1_004008 [Trichoderma atroviride]